jgi:predicted nucleic acid-binding protein
MLDELKSVIVEHLGLNIETANAYVSAIEEYAKLGAQLTLGGTGVIGLRDVEDAHVLETAIAGRADFLVTANFKDFIQDFSAPLSPMKQTIAILSYLKVAIEISQFTKTI